MSAAPITVRDLLAELTRSDVLEPHRLYVRHADDLAALSPVLSVERSGADVVLVCGFYIDSGTPL